MFTRPVMNRRPPPGKAERRIDGNEVGPGPGYPLQDFFVAEGNMRLGLQATEYAYARRAVRSPGKVNTSDNKWFAACQMSQSLSMFSQGTKTKHY